MTCPASPPAERKVPKLLSSQPPPPNDISLGTSLRSIEISRYNTFLGVGLELGPGFGYVLGFYVLKYNNSLHFNCIC